MEIQLNSEVELEGIAQKLSKFLSCGTIFLQGNLGAGKTTFVRYLLRSLGETGKVKSPSYALVESYVLPKFSVHHFDLYRLSDPQELEFIGIRDYLTEENLCIFEWWEKGEGILPDADLLIEIAIQEDFSRIFKFLPQTAKAKTWLTQLQGTQLNNV